MGSGRQPMSQSWSSPSPPPGSQFAGSPANPGGPPSQPAIQRRQSVKNKRAYGYDDSSRGYHDNQGDGSYRYGRRYESSYGHSPLDRFGSSYGYGAGQRGFGASY